MASFGAQTFKSAFGPKNDPVDMRAYLAQAFSIENITQEINHAGAHFFKAFVENEIVGYSKIQTGKHPNLNFEDPTAELQRIYIDSGKLGKGLGKQLLFLTLAEAIKLGKKSIWLGVWEENKAAIRFYQRWGFAKESVHNFTIGKDIQSDWLMARPLPNNLALLEKEFQYEI